MGHDTLTNTSIKIPDLHIRNPHAWYPPEIVTFHHDPLIDDPLLADEQRAGWGEDIADPNYFAVALDEEEAHYGEKLESLAEDLDKDMHTYDEEPSDDNGDHEKNEGRNEQT